MKEIEIIQPLDKTEPEQLFCSGFSIIPKIEINGEYHKFKFKNEMFNGKFSGSNFSIHTGDLNLIDLMRRYMEYMTTDAAMFNGYKIKIQLVVDFHGCFVKNMDGEGKIDFSYDTMKADIAFAK